MKHNFEAWKHGPVLQYLYREFKSYGGGFITTKATKLDNNTGERVVVNTTFKPDELELLNRVARFYCYLSAGHLVNLTHIQGGPWDKVWNHKKDICPGMMLSNEDICEFYSKVRKPFSLH